MEEELMITQLEKEFYEKANVFYEQNCLEYTLLKGKEKRLREKKCPWLKDNTYPRYDELLKSLQYNDACILNTLKRLHISKIQGIYKLAQSRKTAICNAEIIRNLSDSISTMCIAKDTLQANQQWFERLMTDLSKEYIGKDFPKVYVISSKPPSKEEKKKYFDKFIHFRTIESFISAIAEKKIPSLYVLFVCSNKVRVTDLKRVLDVYNNLDSTQQFNLIWDEAHNIKEGIPSKRGIAEYLIFHPRIVRFIPCTATNTDIIEESTLFQEDNLESTALDYTKTFENSSQKSDSPDYSSLHKATQICLEDIRQESYYKDYNITHFEKDLFERNYRIELEKEFRKKDLVEEEMEEKIQSEIERKRELGYHLKMYGEKQYYNDGLNLLDHLDRIIPYEKDPNPTKVTHDGIYLFHTPLRKVFTDSLMQHALKQSYKPIVIGLYNSVIKVCYDSTTEIITEKSLMNDQISKILQSIEQKGRRIGKVIIMGNYSPTGESITFYHDDYGALKASILLGKFRPSEDNQLYSRINYMIRNYTPPDKFMVGERESIANALKMETQNDNRIDRFIECIDIDREDVTFYKKEKQEDEESSKISIPVCCEYEGDSSTIERMKQICKQPKTNETERIEFMTLLFEAIASKDVTIQDPTRQFNEGFILKKLRRYRKPNEADITERKNRQGENYKPLEEDYRLESYDACHKEKIPFMNDKNDIKVGECEMFCCLDKYIKPEFTNPVHRFWISYRFTE